MIMSKKHSVLVIDDDQDYLEIVRLGLGGEFDILTIGDFQSLKAEIHGMKPSIIMLDKGLGEAKPEDVINYIQSLPSLKDIPVYLVSGIDTGKDLALEFDLEGFMVKPHSFQEMRDRLRSILDNETN